MIIGLDFDNTIVTNEYPEIGDDLGALPWLLEAQNMGAQYILFTMRDGHELRDAANYLLENGVRLLGVNTNPGQWQWTMSPKAYCHLYIDDRGLGIPLLDNDQDVDWDRAGPQLIDALRARYAIERGGTDLVDSKRFVGGE